MKDKKLEDFDKKINLAKSEISKMEKTIFGDAGLKMSEKEYDRYFDQIIRKKKALSKLQRERRTLYSRLLGFTESENVNSKMIKTLCL